MILSNLHKETTYQGIPLSKGIAFGKVCFFNTNESVETVERKISVKQIPIEQERFIDAEKAVISMMVQLHKTIADKIGEAEAAIIDAQMMILQDVKLRSDINDYIKENLVSAEKAVSIVMNRYATKFHALEDVYFRERANDIEDLRQRLLGALGHLVSSFSCNGEHNCANAPERIIVTKELTPSLTFKFSAEDTFGFITQQGGINSHAAILARAMNIPAVSGICELVSNVLCGQEVIINGYTGEIIVSPTEETKKKLLLKIEKQKSDKHEEPIEGFKVMATISTADEVEVAVEHGAEGIGLFRTEYEFLAINRFLEFDEQVSRYTKVVSSFPDSPCYIRMLDIGGDKNADWVKIPKESNPYLGLRGARLLLKRPDLFTPQARALAKASEVTNATIYVMFPMIINLQQFNALKELFIEETKDIKSNIKFGLMFETPVACMQADELLQVADFATIGTNDLTQYLLAVDRNNELVADDYDSFDPTMWGLIKSITNAASKHDKDISLCGDLASDEHFIETIINSGLRCISVYPRKVNHLRKSLKSVNLL